MLTAQGPFISLKTSPAEWAIAAVVGLLLYGVLTISILSLPSPAPNAVADAATAPSSVVLGETLLGIKEASGRANVQNVSGVLPRTQVAYLLPFEIVSVHLLVVLIGAAYLARAKRRPKAVAR